MEKDNLAVDESLYLCSSILDSESLRTKNQATENDRSSSTFTKEDVSGFGLVLTENGLDSIRGFSDDITIPDNPNIGIELGKCDSDTMPYNQVLGHLENVSVSGIAVQGSDLYVILDNDDLSHLKSYQNMDLEQTNTPYLMIHDVQNSSQTDFHSDTQFSIEMKTAVFSHDYHDISYRIEDNDRKNELPERKIENDMTSQPDYDLERYRPSDGAISIIENIKEAGGEAYLVGGCIRDAMLGLENHDEDITTSLTPDEVTELFSNIDNASVVPTGIDHGTVTVFLHDHDNHEGYEITTYRIDGASSDQRHPDSVSFSTDIREDLQRRDFTMNAIAYDPTMHEIVDPFGGREDMQNRVICAVGNPNERIDEDALRMMRGVRFSAQKDMDLENGLQTAIENHAGDITHVSNERIVHELTGILMSDHPGDGISALHSTGLLKEILPELDREYDTPQHNPWHIYNVGEHTEKALDNSPKDEAVRFAVLFHDVGKPEVKTTKDGIDHFYGHPDVSTKITEKSLQHFHCSNDFVREVTALVSAHEDRLTPDADSIKHFIEKHPGFDNESLHKLLDVQTADKLGQNPDKNPNAKENAVETSKIIDRVTSDPYRMRDLAINGHDIEGITETKKGDTVVLSGRDIQCAKEKILNFVIEHPEKNNPTDLTSFLQDHLKSIKNESIDKSPSWMQSEQKDQYKERKNMNEIKTEIRHLEPTKLEREKEDYKENGSIGATLEKVIDLADKYKSEIEDIHEQKMDSILSAKETEAISEYKEYCFQLEMSLNDTDGDQDSYVNDDEDNDDDWYDGADGKAD